MTTSILGNWSLRTPTSNNKPSGGTVVVNTTTNEEYEARKLTLVGGVPHPPFIREDVWEAQRSKLTFRPTDIFVTTYSKCGTTLTEQIVCLLLNDAKGDELNPLDKNAYEKHSGIVGKIWTEMAVVEGLGIDDDAFPTFRNIYNSIQNFFIARHMGEMKTRLSVEEFDAVPSPRVLKTHEPAKLFLDQDEKKAKVLYVTRNPFDACVSCYYHPRKGLSPHSRGMPFEGFAKLWLSDLIEFGGWIQHTKGWRQEHQRSSYNMLWLSYEELVGNPLDSIRRVANFIGVDATTDPTLVERVAEGCKFENVRKRAQATLDGGARGHIDHLRLGKVGDWRNHFSDELFHEFEDEIRKQFVGAAADLEYDIGDGVTWAIDKGK